MLPDGYHAIETLMQAVSLCDRLLFSFGDPTITCTDPTIPCDERNLVWQARELFAKTTGQGFDVGVAIDKKIPAQAGLGGGSSNAATTLFTLNELFGCPLSEDDLRALAAQLGSDVPFFFSSGSALCTGRGEVVEDHACTIDELTIVKPKDLHLSTKDVYAEAKVGQGLEEAAFAVCAELSGVKQELLEIFPSVSMSGSGSAFVCRGASPKEMSSDFLVFPCHTLTKKRGEWYTLEHVQNV